jgi:hypothetical protein
LLALHARLRAGERGAIDAAGCRLQGVRPETAKALAILINDFGIGSEKAAILLKVLHQTNAV